MKRPGAFCALLCRAVVRDASTYNPVRLRASTLALRAMHQQSLRPERMMFLNGTQVKVVVIILCPGASFGGQQGSPSSQLQQNARRNLP